MVTRIAAVNPKDTDEVLRVTNALFLVRTFLQYFVARMSPKDLTAQLGMFPLHASSGCASHVMRHSVTHRNQHRALAHVLACCQPCGFYLRTRSIVSHVIGLPGSLASLSCPRDTLYPLHVEAINTLMVGASTQLFVDSVEDAPGHGPQNQNNFVLDLLMSCGEEAAPGQGSSAGGAGAGAAASGSPAASQSRAAKLVSALLQRFYERQESPEQISELHSEVVKRSEEARIAAKQHAPESPSLLQRLGQFAGRLR